MSTSRRIGALSRVAVTALLVAVPPTLVAQSSGRISGSVIDASGASVPAAKVELFLAGGASPISTTETNSDGLYIFPALQAVLYDVSVTAPGFSRAMIRQVKVDPGLEFSMRPVQLEVSTQAEMVEVTAEAVSIQTSNAEIATTVTNLQLTRFPSLNRSPLAFIGIQAGVGGNGRASSTINGMRPSFTNITIDGINIQDNFIRTNTLTFQPNMLQLDQVAEATLSTSNTNVSLGNGAAQISFVTPSGTNALHGNVRWFNRNNAVSANTWFNNRNGVRRPFLNQNQFGGSLGGRIIKDKLFFYGDYEATRLIQQASATRTIFRADARNGIFSYRDTGGAVRSVNLMSLFPGLTRSPAMQNILSKIPGPESINRSDIGDSLNTGGYSFNIRDNRTRDNITGKVDYVASSRHSFSGSFIWNRDIIDRDDLANDYSVVPKVSNDGATNFLSLTHRWNPRPTFTNEARFGFNFAPALFGTIEDFGNQIVTIPLVGNPLNTFRNQGRYSDTYNFSDNATWIQGRHTLSFGFQGMIIRSDPFNDANNLPNYSIGLSTAMAGTYNLLPALPGLRAQDLGAANNLLAFHAGMVTSANQLFNVTSRTSGFVGGASQARRLRQQNLAFYLNDSWKINRKLTITLGMRWEYWSPVDEVDALYLLPQIPQGSDVISTLLSNTTLDFAGKAVNRPWYKKDWNNVAPNIGMAWQPWGDGKTVIRAGYSINYPNDELIRSVDNNVGTNSGLTQTQNLLNQNNVFIDRPVAIPVPPFSVPRLQSANYAASRTSAIGMPDPTLVTPYVQQWNLSVQREITGGVLEIRYVGNRSTKQFRAFDFNQVVVRENGFLADFDKAFNNLRLAQASGRGNNAAYNAAVPGSQPLPFFDRLSSGGLLNNATIVNLINTNQPGELATTYQQNALNGNISFYNNPVALAANMLTNYSNANYNALQIDYSRRFASGWMIQTNYTYSKVMSDSAGDGQTRFEPFLDSQNAAIERARTPFDLTHSFKLAGAYELPIGKGRRVDISNSFLDAVIGGWGVSGISVLRSGAPFSINSGRGTLNRTARSATNTATSTLNKAELDRLLAFRQTGNGPYFVDASAIGPDGRAVAADGAAPFSGQAFFNPGAGTVGALQRRMFSGPGFWNADFQVYKTFKFRERYTADFRADFFNLTNSPSFTIGDHAVNSQNFGRLTGTASARRIIQFGLYLRF